ncbi:twin-arginine translocase TatA/TatE family subunit [Microbacterium abyssi]|uniref:twin-arginine translocase TatA/TatE family subunit n=1 Tax=Microbacterium abyssi TaxID=2782166 RepID=UPI001888DCAB|nr:twin-arginine translocase TatA/TatE family subunit [Microbacterium sp. A18JL241]
MGNLFAGPHLWIILIIILLLFGAAKLPALAKSMGQSARVFKGEMKAMKDDDAQSPAAGGSDATAANTVQENAVQEPIDRPADRDTPPRSS